MRGEQEGCADARRAAALAAAQWPRPETELSLRAGLEPSPVVPTPACSFDGLWSIPVPDVVTRQEFCRAAGGKGEQNHLTVLHAHAWESRASILV